MDTKEILDQFRHLGVPEKLELLELLWDDIVAYPEQVPLSDAQRSLLDQRVRQHQENPDDVHDWEDVRAEAERRLRREP